MADEKGSLGTEHPQDPSARVAKLPRLSAGQVLCVGGAAIDTTFLAGRPLVAGTSNPATGSRAFGGVARNVAENLTRLGIKAGLLSRVGDDEAGRRLIRHLAGLDIDTSGVEYVAGARTAEYVALLEPDRNLGVGVADMAIFDRLDAELLAGAAKREDTDWIFIDCNCAPDLVRGLLDRSFHPAAKRAVDTVSVAKAERLPESLEGIDLLFLNLDEAASILRISRAGLGADDAIRRLQAKGAGEVVLTLGAGGLLAAEVSGAVTAIAAVPAKLADVTGAGDSLVATTIAARLGGLPLRLAARWGCLAATLTLEHVGSTRPDLSFALMAERASLAEQTSALSSSPNETRS